MQIDFHHGVTYIVARKAGFNGILFKSVRYQLEHNLVLFEENTSELSFNLDDKRGYSPSDRSRRSNTR